MKKTTKKLKKRLDDKKRKKIEEIQTDQKRPD